MSEMTTVLIVDDEPIVRDVIVRYLQRDGFDTLEAGDGDAARAIIESGAPDLVVLDVMLPGTDGLALCPPHIVFQLSIVFQLTPRPHSCSHRSGGLITGAGRRAVSGRLRQA